jgi:hypothetical protein
VAIGEKFNVNVRVMNQGRRRPLPDPAPAGARPLGLDPRPGKDYNRLDFHPDDSDTTELVQTWRAELFGEHGTLNDKLMGAA